MSSAVTHTEIYKGYKITVEPDTDPQNPRTEYDNAAKMICFHRRYTLGDKHNYKTPQNVISKLTGLDEDALGANVTDDLGDGSKYRIVWEPLYLYDHSGITMSTTPFGDQWDSGQVGIIYMTYDDILKNFGIEPLNPETWEPLPETIAQAEALLKAEVLVYDQYLRGDVYGYNVYAPNLDADEDADDDEKFEENSCDSCWGFYGEAYTIEAAKEYIDGEASDG